MCRKFNAIVFYLCDNSTDLLTDADKKRSKNLRSGNMTVDTDAIEPCDHHLDCLPGDFTHLISKLN